VTTLMPIGFGVVLFAHPNLATLPSRRCGSGSTQAGRYCA
jgi:hypothetical protein